MDIQIGLDFGTLIAMIINFGIVFFLIKKYATAPIVEALTKRKELIHKLENAEAEYDLMIKKAHADSQDIMAEAKNKKDSMINEAQLIAKEESNKILQKAEKDSDAIRQKAEEDGSRLSQELESNFEKGVKNTTEVVIKKLLGNDQKIEEKYMEQLIAEAKK